MSSRDPLNDWPYLGCTWPDNGPCDRCGGMGDLPVNYYGPRPTAYVPCVDCKGSGRKPDENVQPSPCQSEREVVL